MCPSTRAPGRASSRAPSAVTAPVRMSVSAGGVDHGLRHAGAGVVEREQAVLRRQPALVVVDVVADDLDAGQRERRDVAAEHVEVPAERLVGPQVDARLDHRLAQALRAQAALDRVQDLVVRQPERLDVGPVEIRQVELVCHRGSMQRRGENRERRRSGASLVEQEEDASPKARDRTVV